MIADKLPHASGTADHQAHVKARLEIEENARNLKGCSGPHGFVPIAEVIDGEVTKTGRSRCVRCQGTVTNDQAIWYKRGLAHGRDNP